MDHYYPTNGSSTLSYQGINIILPTDLHLHQHHPTDGSSLSFILPMDEHYPTNGSSLLFYQWINIVLPTDLYHHHPPYRSLLSSFYQWIFISIILSVDHC
ncbi:hypothetical protein KY284_011493 [Solanum tuberosum]|nr:hypothetical protein KY284_011493 [Solanum tuberosum]